MGAVVVKNDTASRANKTPRARRQSTVVASERQLHRILYPKFRNKIDAFKTKKGHLILCALPRTSRTCVNYCKETRLMRTKMLDRLCLSALPRASRPLAYPDAVAVGHRHNVSFQGGVFFEHRLRDVWYCPEGAMRGGA